MYELNILLSYSLSCLYLISWGSEESLTELRAQQYPGLDLMAKGLPKFVAVVSVSGFVFFFFFKIFFLCFGP